MRTCMCIISNSSLFTVAFAIVVALLALPSFCNSAQQWTKVASNNNVGTSVYGVSSDASGDYITLVTNTGFFYSSNRGFSFTKLTGTGSSINTWATVSSSSDGKVVAAGVFFGGGVYFSTEYNDGPFNLASLPTTNTYYNDVKVSSSGQYIAASMYTGTNPRSSSIYLSSNYGVDWTLLTAATLPSDHVWASIDGSSDFQYLAALDGYSGAGGVYISADRGVSWSGPTSPSISPAMKYVSLACNSSCKQIVVAVSPGGVYVSNNYGAISSWTHYSNLPTTAYWNNIASDVTGTNMLVATTTGGGGQGLIYVTNDNGQNWYIASAPSGEWRVVATDSSGSQMIAAMNNVGVYVSQDKPSSQPTLQPSSRPTCMTGKLGGHGSSCEECPAGYHSVPDRSTCLPCDINSYSAQGADSCTLCDYPTSNHDIGSDSCSDITLASNAGQGLAVFLCISLFGGSKLILLISFGRKKLEQFIRCVALLFLQHLLLLSNIAYLLTSRFYSSGLFAACVLFLIMPNVFFLWKLYKTNRFYPKLFMIAFPLQNYENVQSTIASSSNSGLIFAILMKLAVFVWGIINIPIVVFVMSIGFYIFQSGLIYMRSINNIWSSIWTSGILKSNQSFLSAKSLFSFSSITISSVPKLSEFDAKSYNEALLVVTFLQAIPQLIIQQANNKFMSSDLSKWPTIAIVSFIVSLIFAIRGCWKLIYYIGYKRLDVDDIPLDVKVTGLKELQLQFPPKSPRSAPRAKDGSEELIGDGLEDIDIEINFNRSDQQGNGLQQQPLNSNTPTKASRREKIEMSKKLNPDIDCGVIADWLLRKADLKYKYSEQYALLLAHLGIIVLDGPKSLKEKLSEEPMFLETLNIPRTHAKQIYLKLFHRKYPVGDEGAIYPGTSSGSISSSSKKNSLLANSPIFIELPNKNILKKTSEKQVKTLQPKEHFPNEVSDSYYSSPAGKLRAKPDRTLGGSDLDRNWINKDFYSTNHHGSYDTNYDNDNDNDITDTSPSTPLFKSTFRNPSSESSGGMARSNNKSPTNQLNGNGNSRSGDEDNDGSDVDGYISSDVNDERNDGDNEYETQGRVKTVKNYFDDSD